MSLKDQITSDMRDAMRAHDKEKLSALRMLLSSIKQKEVDEQITADDAVIQQIIAKLIKQRKDSVEQYLAGNRKDLADKESAEIKTFEVYLPAQLSDEEIQKIVERKVFEGITISYSMLNAVSYRAVDSLVQRETAALEFFQLCHEERVFFQPSASGHQLPVAPIIDVQNPDGQIEA